MSKGITENLFQSIQVEETSKGYCMSHDGRKPGLSKNNISQQNFIHASENQQKVIEILNHTLADEALLRIKTRNAKWNVSGPGFIELRSLFELHLTQVNDFSDEIAKRIHTLHGQQIISISEYIAGSRLSETPEVIPNVFQLLADHESLIRFFLEDCEYCTKFYDDTSTSEMLQRIIRQHEKITLKLRSFIKRISINNVYQAIF